MVTVYHIFDVYRLFQFKAPSELRFFTALIIFYFVLFTLAMALRLFIIPRLKKQFERRYYSDIFLDLFLTALAGIILLLVRRAGASFISARIFLFLLLFHFLGKLCYYLYFRLAFFPKFLSAYYAEQKRIQYLPKKGKKKKQKK